MSTLALPIDQLIPVVGDAKKQTESVVVCSRAERADTTTAWHILRKTIGLKFQLADLVRRQERLISKLVEFEFAAAPAEKVKEIAASIDGLVTDERDLLLNTQKLGTELRVWWHTSLTKLSAQVEHLDSISESLHFEVDETAPILMAMAVEQFSME